MKLNITQIARICHETNRAYFQTIGDPSQKSWHDAAGWQRDSAIKGVQFKLDNPDAPASRQHDAWMADKMAQGWVWGTEKNEDLKTHPFMMPYDHLPAAQRLKDFLFVGIVEAFRKAAAE